MLESQLIHGSSIWFKIVSVIVTGTITYLIYIINSSKANLEKDRTWFGKLWTNFLADYDKQWNETKTKLEASGCEYVTFDVDSSKTFGPRSQTKVHICGKRTNPALLLIPGFRNTSTMWVNNLQDLSKHYCVVTLDYPFDLGRSVHGYHHDGLVQNIADKRNMIKKTNFLSNEKSATMITTWINDILKALEIEQLSAIGGFSLGAYLSCLIALHTPELLEDKAKMFLLAPPASFSSFRWLLLLPKILRTVWRDVSGLPLPTSLCMASNCQKDYNLEKKTGTAEDIDLEAVLKSYQVIDEVIQLSGTLPNIPFPVREFTMEELQRIAEKFDPTYVCLEWDCWYHSDIAHQRAKDAGVKTIFVEKTTHRFPKTQPKKFHALALEALL